MHLRTNGWFGVDGSVRLDISRICARQRACYRELIQLTVATADYATYALAHLECLPPTPARDRVRTQLTTLLPLVTQVIDQTTRRVLQEEAVPADEKLVSLVEAHTDVLRKEGQSRRL